MHVVLASLISALVKELVYCWKPCIWICWTIRYPPIWWLVWPCFSYRWGYRISEMTAIYHNISPSFIGKYRNIFSDHVSLYTTKKMYVLYWVGYAINWPHGSPTMVSAGSAIGWFWSQFPRRSACWAGYTWPMHCSRVPLGIAIAWFVPSMKGVNHQKWWYIYWGYNGI